MRQNVVHEKQKQDESGNNGVQTCEQEATAIKYKRGVVVLWCPLMKAQTELHPCPHSVV